MRADCDRHPEPGRRPQPRPRTLFLDGYNVLHAGLLGEDRTKWWCATRRQQLLALAEDFQNNDTEIWVVFDGPFPGPGESGDESRPPPGVRCVFAPSADDWLLARVRGSADPGRIGVVTADRKLADRIRHRGAQVIDPRWFLKQCTS